MKKRFKTFPKTSHLLRPKAKKSLGQNFLINPRIVDTIIEAAEITPENEVVEVGPGLGILTKQLLKKAKTITAIELDQDLIPHLQKLADQHKNLSILHADALKTDLPRHPYKVVANIPYYITSPLLNHFLQPKTEEGLRPNLLVFMVQKEVAEKICAQSGDHSILSLQVQIFGQPRIITTVSKANFNPAPKVDSAVIKIEVYAKPLIQNIPIFFKLISAAFSQKRKTLLNSLQNGLKITKEETSLLLKAANIPENDRPQNLSIEQWQVLTESFTSLAPKHEQQPANRPTK